jgi:hypothetical protein
MSNRQKKIKGHKTKTIQNLYNFLMLQKNLKKQLNWLKNRKGLAEIFKTNLAKHF